MTPVRREALYHDLCDEVFRGRRILKRVSGIRAAGFPMSHLVSVMMQLPMKLALAKARSAWREGPGVEWARAEEAADEAALAAPAPARLASGVTVGRAVHDLALGAWIAVLAFLAVIELSHGVPSLGGIAPHVLPLETHVETAAWAALALVGAAAACVLALRRALGVVRSQRLRFGTALRGAAATLAALGHVALALVD
jgi:hypothetical protein